MSTILSLENILIVKNAIVISLSPEVKREILCIPGSEYDVCKSRYLYYRKKEWNAIVERKAKEILKHHKLPEMLQDKVMRILPAIALRMLIWAVYHEGILGLTRYFSLNFLSYSHFTKQGVIDNKKAAEDMLKVINLNIKQKYKLACIYCLIPHISSFFKQIVGDKKDMVFSSEDFKLMEKPEIVNFWTFQFFGRIDKQYIHNSHPYRLQKAIKSGSKETVMFSLERTSLLSREYFLMYAAKEVLSMKSETNDWIIFRDQRYDDSTEYWVPNDYSVDILCFVLSNMTELQQQRALEKNIKSTRRDHNGNKQDTVLESFLCWPYQDYFMNTAALLWDFMPLKTYAVILFKICDAIEPRKRKNLLYGEERSYDYRKLLKDFWIQSPDRFKRYIFKNKSVAYRNNVKVKTKTGIGLLLKLISLKTFTYADEEIIGLILDSATDEEKANLTTADWWRSTCINILKNEKFEIFDRLLLVFCKSAEETNKFIIKLNFSKAASEICSHFLYYGKMKAVKSLINRISLPVRDLSTLKKTIIYSNGGVKQSQKFLSSGRYEDFEEFSKWFLTCTKKYKRFLRSHYDERVPNSHISRSELLDVVFSYTRSNLPHREAIKVLRASIADKLGCSVCEELIAGSPSKLICEKDFSVITHTEFKGGKWERVDEFLTWCLSTKKKILEFKETLFKKSGVKIHYNLIKSKQWKTAQNFYDWLGLSEAKIKDFKKRVLYDRDACWSMIHYLVFNQDDEMRNLETIDLLLRWHLTDKESVIKFCYDFFDSHEDYDEASLKKFNSLIESYLEDLEKEEIYQTCRNAEERFFRYLDGGCLKRKSTRFHPQKKLRLSSTVEEKEQNKRTGNSSRRKYRLSGIYQNSFGNY